MDWTNVLHGEQGLVIHRPLPPEGNLVGRLRIDEIIDKGQGKGSLLYSTREIRDAATGDLLCSLAGTTFLRADGGIPYARVVEIMGALNAGGFANIILVTDPGGPTLTGAAAQPGPAAKTGN